jgi:sugar phosphate isomerase/epimerase
MPPNLDRVSPARVRWATQLSALTTDPEAVDEWTTDELAALGFEGVIVHFGLTDTSDAVRWEDPRNADLGAIERAADTLRRGGIEPLSTWGYWAPLVATDDDVRREAVAQVAAAADVALALGCPYVVTGAGSNAPESGWRPHPDNHGPKAVARLIQALEAAVPEVAKRGIELVLKPHVLSTLRSPEIISQVLEAIDTPDLRVGFDPVNLVRLEDVYGGRELMDACITAAHGRLGHAHVKDFVLRSDTITNIAEVPVGHGALDLPYFLSLAGRHAQGGWVTVEHLERAQLADAVAQLERNRPE